jgi:hypothetical protein
MRGRAGRVGAGRHGRRAGRACAGSGRDSRVECTEDGFLSPETTLPGYSLPGDKFYLSMYIVRQYSIVFSDLLWSYLIFLIFNSISVLEV